jgi:luciferase family oxidoreductase group 1
MANEFSLGALDLGKLLPGQTHHAVIWESIELAPRLEQLGYGRYWLAEHHGSDVAHGSPELLATVLAGVTSKMRIGVAGVLLRLYSPYKVAQDFRLLHTIFPHRIDLGIARGHIHPAREQVLAATGTQIPFEEKLAALLGYLRGTLVPVANPAHTLAPQIWMLGSHYTSMRLAAEMGTAFCYALFLDAESGASVATVLQEYRQRFKPSATLAEPAWSIALAGICADDEDQAQAMASAGPRGVVANVVGTCREWRSQFLQLRDQTGTTEFIVADLSRGLQGRLRSYELIAESGF